MSEAVKRRYDARRRQEQARQNRLAVLRAAHDLFVERGYGRTTIADVAAAAGVSGEMIYAAFKTKANLLHRVWDVTIGGDDKDVAFHERPEIRRLRAEPDLARRFVLQARTLTATMRRVTPLLLALRGAASSEPAAAELMAEIDRQRLAGLAVMAREAAATGRLAVSEQECLDLVWAMADGSLWHRLVVERGWSDEQYADYVGRMWVAALVRPAARAPRH